MKYNPVIEEENHSISYCSEVEDFVQMQNGVLYNDFNIKGVHLLEERNHLDYSLIKDIEIFIIETVEEYSVAFTQLILTEFPGRKIYFLDKNARKIWNNAEVVYVTDVTELKKIHGRSMYIYSEVNSIKQPEIHIEDCNLIYSSLMVLQSLCWARKKVSLGEKNPDKTILLIEFNCKNAGMGDIVISVQQYIRLARMRGWYPVVRLTEENQYISQVGDNMWDYYFEQPTEITVQEALQSKHVIGGKQNHFGVLPWLANPICNMNDALKERIILKQDTLKEFQNDMPRELLQNSKVLAVIARGSDLAKCTHLQIDIEEMIAEVQENFAKGFEYIFLATEDEKYLQLFQKKFGDKLLYIEQKRISHDYEKEEYKYVADLLGIKQEKRKNWGSQYLLITYCLSKCDALLYSIPCGALRLANIWREHSWNFMRCTYRAVKNLRDNHDKYLVHIYECESFLKQNDFVIVYGLGDVAQMISPIFEKYREKIIPCDKRAVFEEFDFLGRKVIAPTELLTYVKDVKGAQVLITSPRCGKEIQMELLQMGISREKIVQLDY